MLKISICTCLMLIIPIPVMSATAIKPIKNQTAPCSFGEDASLHNNVVWPKPRFTNVKGETHFSDEVVVDRLTGLMWPRVSDASGPAACGAHVLGQWVAENWKDALSFVACLNANNYLGFSDWRLPALDELRSLVNSKEPNSTIWLNSQGFTNVQPCGYWSSTNWVEDTTYACVVIFSVNQMLRGPKDHNYAIWPVRDVK